MRISLKSVSFTDAKQQDTRSGHISHPHSVLFIFWHLAALIHMNAASEQVGVQRGVGSDRNSRRD